MSKQLISKTFLVAVLAVAVMMSGAVFLQTAEAVEAEDPVGSDDVVAILNGTEYSDLADAIQNATDGDTIQVVGDVALNSEMHVEKNVSFVGVGDPTFYIDTTAGGLKFLFDGGYGVEVSGITFQGYTVSGLIKWEPKDVMTNSETARLSITDCVIAGTDEQDNNAGIGFFSNGTASSEVVVSDCIFTRNSMGVYLNDEPNDNINLNVTVSGCTFTNGYAGIYGVLTNVEVYENTFDASMDSAVELILNSTNTDPDVVIRSNVIDSVNGITMGPYQLNQGNGKGGEDTVAVTSEMMPQINDNVRHTDSNMVTINGYRLGSDELLFIEEGALDLSNNYAGGGEPTCTVNYDSTEGVDPELLSSAVSQNSVASTCDVYYVDEDMTMTNKDARPSTPNPGWSDDDDEYVPPIYVVQDNGSGSDDTITVVACAAAAVVAALMAVFLIIERRRI